MTTNLTPRYCTKSPEYKEDRLFGGLCILCTKSGRCDAYIQELVKDAEEVSDAQLEARVDEMMAQIPPSWITTFRAICSDP